MDNKIEEEKRKQEEIKDKELTRLMKSLFAFIVLSTLFGYIGFLYCSENGLDVQKGMTYGALFPLGLSLIREMGFGSGIVYIIYAIAYYLLAEKAPAIIGIVIIFTIIGVYIIDFIYISFKDRTPNKDEKSRLINNKVKSKKVEKENIINKSKVNDKAVEIEKHNLMSDDLKNSNYSTIEDISYDNGVNSFLSEEDNLEESMEIGDDMIEESISLDDDTFEKNMLEDNTLDDSFDIVEDIIKDEEEYYCIRCGEKITEDEDIENGSLCEDCYAEVYFGERYKGDDYDLYK